MSIQNSKSTKHYVIKSFTSLSDYEDKGVRGSFKDGVAINVRKRADTLTCNQALADIDNPSSRLIDQIVYFQVNSSDGNTYLFGTSKIWKLTTAGVLTLAYTDPDGQICGAAEWPCSNGKTYMFWMTATKVKCKEIPGNATWSVDVNANVVVGAATYTYPKTNLTSATWHTAAVANGALLMCNKDKIGLIGFDGSYTNEALLLLPGSVSKDIIDRNDYAIIAAGSNTDALSAHIYSWQQGALTYLQKKKIPAKNINGLIDGEVMLMQADDNGAIFFSDFYNFLPVTAFPSGGKINPGGRVMVNEIAYFGVWGCTDTTKNGIYSYGRAKKNGIFSLNFEYPITCTEIGSLGIVNGVLHVGYRNSTTYRVYKVDSAAKQVATYSSLDLPAPVKPAGQTTTWEIIKLITKKLPAGTKINVNYRLDKDILGTNNGWIAAKLQSGSADYDVTGATQALFKVASVADIVEVQVILTPTANLTPEVSRIEIAFS